MKKKKADIVNIHIEALEDNADIYIYIPKRFWSQENVPDAIRDAIESTFSEKKLRELN
jgi:hypothetical protein